MHVTAQTRTATVPTPEHIAARWLSAFRRAVEQGTTPRRLDRERWAVASASRTPVVYIVEGTREGLTCTCPAHEYGNVACHHKASVIMDLDRAPTPRRPEPEPEPPCPGGVRSFSDAAIDDYNEGRAAA